jgi:DNA-binding response OmpR family regulator
MRIVFASPRAADLAEFVAGLGAEGARVVACPSGAQALQEARAAAPDLVVADSGLPDLTALEFVVELLKVNAMIPCAVLSRLSDEDFHAASEGLGVLARVPWSPGRGDAGALLAALRSLNP